MNLSSQHINCTARAELVIRNYTVRMNWPSLKWSNYVEKPRRCTLRENTAQEHNFWFADAILKTDKNWLGQPQTTETRRENTSAISGTTVYHFYHFRFATANVGDGRNRLRLSRQPTSMEKRCRWLIILESAHRHRSPIFINNRLGRYFVLTHFRST